MPGIGAINEIFHEPTGTVPAGTNVTIKWSLRNDGDSNDTIWWKFYRAGVLMQEFGVGIPAGGIFEWAYYQDILTETTQYHFDVGHGYQHITQDNTYDYTVNVGVGPTPDICNWIINKGGPTGLDIVEVFEMVDSYVFQIPPPGYQFIPVLNEIFGIIDYYLGFIDSGNEKTGCY